MDPAPGSNEQTVAAAAAAALAASGQRAIPLMAQGLIDLRARVANSVVRVEVTRGGKKINTPGIIIAATPTYSYVLVRRICVADCDIVFSDGARFTIKKHNFITNPHLALAKINHGSVTPVVFTEIPVSFLDNVYLYVLHGRGMTPGSVVNPTGESEPSHIAGDFLIDNVPDLASVFGAPVFDEKAEFLGIVTGYSFNVMGAAMIKDILRRDLPNLVLGELMSLNVL